MAKCLEQSQIEQRLDDVEKLLLARDHGSPRIVS
jgi:hypothetical protein